MSFEAQTDERSHEQFMRLFAVHHRRVFAYVLALTGNEDQADEVFQDTCVTLWKQFAKFEPGTDFMRWAATIALNQVRNDRRTRGRDRLVFSDALVEQLAERRVGLLNEDEPRRRALGQCMGKLRETDRQLVERCYADGRSFKSIAAEIGRPVNTVYKALNRIRASLMQCIETTLSIERES